MRAWLTNRRHWFYGGLAVALVISIVISLAASFHLFHSVRTLLSDQLFRATTFQHAAPAGSDIVIVTIDNASLAALGPFSSWPRSDHATLVNDLNADGARLIVFDILFSETTPDDGTFATAMANAGDVILPYVYSQSSYATTAAGRSLTLQDRIDPTVVLREQALTLGHAVMLPDEDGIVREVPLYLGSPDAPQPSLSLAAVAEYLRRPVGTDGPIANDRVPLAGREIPVDRYGNMLINYALLAGGNAPFTEVSYSDVLNGTADPSLFQDKIVLIGVTATGLGDTFWTPLGELMHGVELHATAMETILSDQFLRQQPAWADWLIILLLGLAAGALVQRLRVAWGALAVAGIVIGYVVASVFAFESGILTDLLFPPLAAVAAAVGVNMMTVVCERAEKQDLEQTFGRYVSPEVAERILEERQHDQLGLQGASRVVTALYIDARNFTGLMESHAPEEVFQSLNIYMKGIIAAVQHHDGIINKFTGDGLLAIWNAPVENAHHAEQAVAAAVVAQQTIREMRESGAAEMAMVFGIGIMTGTAYVGTMGSRNRQEYAVLGDAVNTASRLCDLAPGDHVWLGEATYELVKGRFHLEKVGDKALKGRQQPLGVYEVLDGGRDVNNP